MTAALEGGEWSAARPGRTLPLGKTRYQLYRELAGLQGRSGRVEDIALPGFDLRTVQPVASHCTDYATLPTSFSVGTLFYLTNLITTLLWLFRETAAGGAAFWAIPFPFPTRFSSCTAVNRLKRSCSLRLTKVLGISAFGLLTPVVSDVDGTLQFYNWCELLDKIMLLYKA